MTSRHFPDKGPNRGRNTIGDTIPVHFLVYTRTASFDYQWVYGLGDAHIEQRLENHLLSWLNTNQLAKLNSVTAFFRFEDYQALMLAQGSETRSDRQGRQIFQRAVYLWKPTEGLYYRHLEPLAMMLAEEADRVYAELPNNVLSFPKKVQAYGINIYALDEEATTLKLQKHSWKLPKKLSWQTVAKGKFTVEVPNSWGFEKMIAGLADQPLLSSGGLYIGHSLHTDNRYPSEHGWVVSARRSSGDSDDTIRILRANGEPLEDEELKDPRWKKSPTTGAAEPTADGAADGDPKRLPTGRGEAPREQAPPADLRDRQASHEGGEASDDKAAAVDLGPGPQEGAEAFQTEAPAPSELERLFSEFTSLTPNREGWEFGRVFRKFLERGQLPIVETETRILLLLTPASLRMPNDIIIAWHYLLSEILLSYHRPSKGVADEWIRRSSELESITVRNSKAEYGNWPSEFSEACNALRTILKSL
jgi:hypothetical protein